jgi:hypothetical protein
MMRIRPTLSILSLIAANLVPLAGALALGWDAGVLVVLYWTENVIIGSYNILKIALARPQAPRGHAMKLILIPFFCVHFGIFCAVHGFFLRTFFTPPTGIDALLPRMEGISVVFLPNLMLSLIRSLSSSSWGIANWAIVGLLASHGISFVQNYLVGREYETQSITEAMFKPYVRVVALHVAILAGGVVVVRLGSPAPLLFVLVLFKICLDLFLHVKEHASRPR